MIGIRGKHVAANLVAVQNFNIRTWKNKKYIKQGTKLN
jgi:hypothetical protein